MHGVESRPLDFVFDASNITGSTVDYNKQMSKAQTYDPLIQPIYRNMFSKLRNYPSVAMKYRPNVDLTKLAAAAEHGYISQQYQNELNQGHLHGGTLRYKYNAKPLVPYVAPLVVFDDGKLAKIQQQLKKAQQKNETKSEEPPTKTVAMQTMYRESSAQTVAYSPEYILPPPTPGGTQHYPEVLTLLSLNSSTGLPVASKEIEMIERARAKREWLASLPEPTDAASFEKRLRLMEKMELQEWKDREKEISEVHEARLSILRKIIEGREKENEEINKERLEKVWLRKLQERDTLLEKLHRKKEKEIKRLEYMRNKLDKQVTRRERDVIDNYAKNSKQMKRKAVEQNTKTSHLAVRETSTSLTKLQEKFREEIEKVDISIPQSSLDKNDYGARKQAQYQRVLQSIWEKTQEKPKDEQESKPNRFAVKIEKPPVRASTPVVDTMPQNVLDIERSALLLQSTMRGVFVRSEMKEGVERRRDLIEELRIKHELELEETRPTEPIVSPYLTTNKPESPIKHLMNVAPLRHEVSVGPSDLTERQIETTLTAEYLGRLFDFYTKQLVILREEQKIAALVYLAERTRKLKEAEERGRREEELKRRDFEEKVFKEVMGVNDETIESYLASVILEANEATVDQKAFKSVQKYAEQINQWTEELEQRHTNNPETVRETVSDLVLSFLIPEVERELVRQSAARDQQKYLIAAREALEAVPEGMKNDFIPDTLEKSIETLSLGSQNLKQEEIEMKSREISQHASKHVSTAPSRSASRSDLGAQ